MNRTLARGSGERTPRCRGSQCKRLPAAEVSRGGHLEEPDEVRLRVGKRVVKGQCQGGDDDDDHGALLERWTGADGGGSHSDGVVVAKEEEHAAALKGEHLGKGREGGIGEGRGGKGGIKGES